MDHYRQQNNFTRILCLVFDKFKIDYINLNRNILFYIVYVFLLGIVIRTFKTKTNTEELAQQTIIDTDIDVV